MSGLPKEPDGVLQHPKNTKKSVNIFKMGIDIVFSGWYTNQGLYRFAFYGADVSTDYLTVDYKPPSIVYSISYRTNSIKGKRLRSIRNLFLFQVFDRTTL